MTAWDLQPPLLEQQLLLHELNHRVNNEFASAINAVSVAAARSGNEEVKLVMAGVVDLLHRYADVHRALQAPDIITLLDAATYIRRLCFSISRSKLDHKKIGLVFAASPMQLQSDRCWRMGMIVHELITNAARHAFAGEKGEIQVELLRVGSVIACKVQDDGSLRRQVRHGRGLKIIEMLAKTLDGRFEQKFGSLGSTSMLAFPYYEGEAQKKGHRGCVERKGQSMEFPQVDAGPPVNCQAVNRPRHKRQRVNGANSAID
ncbi:MAG: ATP-binding protein [Xanthobacteraceae bacterium]